MDSRAKLFGHPLHQMLIVFPLGLLGTSIVFDIAFLTSRAGRWADISFWMIAVGILAGLVAAVFGLIDFLSIPKNTRAKTIGMYHGLGNAGVLSIFAVSWLLRRPAPDEPSGIAVALSISGVLLAAVTGWLGGELVDRLGVGVHEGAHLNAPSSLTKHHASESAPQRRVPTANKRAPTGRP